MDSVFHQEFFVVPSVIGIFIFNFMIAQNNHRIFIGSLWIADPAKFWVFFFQILSFVQCSNLYIRTVRKRKEDPKPMLTFLENSNKLFNQANSTQLFTLSGSWERKAKEKEKEPSQRNKRAQGE